MKTIGDITAECTKTMAARTEAACERLAAMLGEGWETRCEHVRRETGNVWGDEWSLTVDGVVVWRLWWEQQSEYAWTIYDEWTEAGRALAHGRATARCD